MKVLIVANHNKGYFVPFIKEQVDALQKLNIEIDYFGVHGKGMIGYLSNLKALRAKVREFKPDIVHAHYGLSGLLANLQRMVPVVTTYHGSDIHAKGLNLFLSRIAIFLSSYNIFVSYHLMAQAGCRRQAQCVLPCGVDTSTIKLMDRSEARKQLGWEEERVYVLFSGSFDIDIKNSPLAEKAVALVDKAQLVELKGYDREHTCLMMNAANCLIMTSFHEGSPQVIKEALTCGTPIVSVDVGDVKELIHDINGCYITSYEANDIADKLKQAIAFKGKTRGPQCIKQHGLSNEQIARRILRIYQEIESTRMEIKK